jgi:DNA-binding CsgD family transcriptional regulator
MPAWRSTGSWPPSAWSGSATPSSPLVERLRAGKVATDTAPILTRREMEILLSIERGESVRETATGLGISVKTVQNLQSRLFHKLGARNRSQAIARAYEVGLVEDVVP